MSATLSQIALFHGLSDQELQRIATCATTQRYAKGSTMITEGEPGRSMYVLMEGRVKVFVSDTHGKEYVLAILGPGEYVGEMALLDDEPRTASVQTEEVCSFMVLQKDDFLAILQAHPEIQYKLLLNLVRRTRQLTESVKNLALKDVYTRLRLLLEELVVERDGVWMLDEPMTQQAMADRVGSSREMVARILKELVFGGYVKLENRRLVILHRLPEAF